MKFIIEINEKEHIFCEDEARDLWEQLDRIFKEEKTHFVWPNTFMYGIDPWNKGSYIPLGVTDSDIDDLEEQVWKIEGSYTTA